MHLPRVLSCVVALVLASAARADEVPSRFEYAQLHMGVKVRLVVYAPDETSAERACAAAFARVAELERICSDYRPDSELMQLCARAGDGGPVQVSPELFLLLSRARTLSEQTGGLYDVAAGPVIRLWRTSRRTGKLPDEHSLRDALARTGHGKMLLDPEHRTIRLLVPGMQLDLGGIAKGYAGDEAIRVLSEHGITSALFEAGGDIVVSGPPPGKDGWTIAVPDPAAPDANRTITLAHRAASTSGDTVQYVEIDGRRYSHIVNPLTGLGLTDGTLATVIAPDGLTSDSLATAVNLVGEARGRRLLERYPSAELMASR